MKIMLQGREVTAPKIYEGEAQIQQMQVITQSDLDGMADEHRRALKQYGRHSEQAKRTFRFYKRMAYRKELLDCERSQMVEGEWEITQMQAVTIEDVLQKREERRQAADKYGLDSAQATNANKLYKRMIRRMEDLDWQKREKEKVIEAAR